MNQDTGIHRTNTKDQFYTNPEIAQQCIQQIIDYIPDVSQYLWVEPSAGSGSFLCATPNHVETIAIDIAPAHPDVKQQDFLFWECPATDKRILIYGNPPFGRQSRTAKQFINKSCTIADAIAFILPRSFTKPSMNSAFADRFHLIHSWDVPPDAFIVNATPYDVSCVFQIWKKQNQPRIVAVPAELQGGYYVKHTDAHDIIIRRVGVNAGKCFTPGVARSAQSHYFIKLDDRFITHTQQIVRAVSAHVFPSNTVGPRSLSKGEINVVLTDILLNYR